jgi:hypothetical protein
LRPARIVLFTAAALTAAALGGSAPPAVAQTILVTPSSAHPGQRIHISVPGCGVAVAPHTATSPAFTHDVMLHGKADTGEGDPTIRKGLTPGTYPITAHCEDKHTVQGQVVVAAKSGGQPPAVVHTPAPSPATTPVGSISAAPTAAGNTRGWATIYWALAAAVAILLAIVVLLRSHNRP